MEYNLKNSLFRSNYRCEKAPTGPLDKKALLGWYFQSHTKNQIGRKMLNNIFFIYFFYRFYH